MARISVTWKKSTIGFPRNQRRTIAGLGLRRLNQTVVHEASPSIIGMVDKVKHLVELADVKTSTTRRKASTKTKDKSNT